MRNFFSISIILICALNISAQQKSQYTHYVFNQFALNPAVAGSEKCIDIKLGYRTQWVGFEDAPTTGVATVHSSFGVKEKTAYKTKHGIGVMIETDETGPTGRTLFQIAYAYHFPFKRDKHMSIGLFAGFNQYRFDASKVTLFDFDDPAINGSASNIIFPEFTPGIWIYAQKYYLGFSVHQLTNNVIKEVGLDSRLKPHAYLNYGRALKVSKFTKAIPSVLLKYSSGKSIIMDLNFMMEFDQKISLGFSYRTIDAVAALVKFKILKNVTAAYAFDYTTSQLRFGSSNTHEVIIGINACSVRSNDRVEPCSAYD